ncbi:MAG TPA: hypothetical protein VF397_14125 [Pyrinomonadaceae bacterium]
MSEPIFKREPTNDRDEQAELDLRDMKGLADSEKDFLKNLSHLEERNRGAIGKMTLLIIAFLVLVLPVLGGCIAAFGSATQAQAFTANVVTLLDAVARVANVVIWPVMAYYFLQFNSKK